MPIIAKMILVVHVRKFELIYQIVIAYIIMCLNNSYIDLERLDFRQIIRSIELFVFKQKHWYFKAR